MVSARTDPGDTRGEYHGEEEWSVVVPQELLVIKLVSVDGLSAGA